MGTSSTVDASAATASRTLSSFLPPAAWTDNEHEKCLEALDVLVHSTRRLHSDDAGSPTRRQRIHAEQQQNDSVVSMFKAQEDHELHLISTALHAKDIVGLFSLLTVFWSTRNRLVRESETLQYRLGGASSNNVDTEDSGHQHRSQLISFDDALQAAQERLDAMHQSITSIATASSLLSAGAADALLKERQAALVWHQRILEEGSYVDVIKLSVDLQQEYQKSQGALQDPFHMLLGGGPTTTGEGGRTTLLSAASTQLVEKTDFDYLDSLHAMVTSSLQSQAAVKDELVGLVTEYDASAQTFAAPPVMRLLGANGTANSQGYHYDHRAPRSSTTVFAQHQQHDQQPQQYASTGDGDYQQPENHSIDVEAALRLVPEYSDDVVDPLTALGGASFIAARHHRDGGHHSNSDVSGLWRLIKFVSVECAAGETFLSVLQRASLATKESVDSNNSSNRSAGGGAPEQWNARNVFCPINKKPVVECVGMWLPPDPRLASGLWGGGGESHFRHRSAAATTATTTAGSLLHAVLKDAMPLVVRVVVPLRSLAPAIRALLSQRHTLEHETIPKLRKDVADAKQLLWSAEIEAIEQRTARGGTTGQQQQPHLASAGGAAQIKARLQSLEAQDAVCVQALSQCQEHLRALEHGDLASLSAMLTASTSRIGGAGGADTSSLNVAERIVYVCKELPRGSSLEEFAASFGVPVDDLHVFEDLAVVAGHQQGSFGSPAAAAASAAWASAVGEEPPQQHNASIVTTSQRRTLVYIPVRVPVTSAVEQDRLLTQELEDYAREYPSFPPNAEVLDHLAALRRGDLNTLSALLSSTRAKRKAFDDTSRAGALQRRIDDLQHEVSRLLHEGDTLKEALRSSDALVREKSTALERLSWHQHRHVAGNQTSGGYLATAEQRTPVPLDPSRLRSSFRSNDAYEAGEVGAEMEQDEEEYRFLLSEWTPDACMQRGMSPAEALEHLTKLVSKQEASITSLRLLVRKSEEERENTTKETILRLGSGTARLKQVKDLELTVDGLKQELKEEGRRGAELTARLVQLEQLNGRLTKDLANQQRALQTSKEAHRTDVDEVKTLRKDLREAEARTNTAERDAQRALEVQLLSSTRHTFAAKEIPKGMTAPEFLRHLGVHGPVAEISLAKGAVFDELRQAHFVYVPVQVERGPWSVEDEKLQSDMARASVELQRVGAPHYGSGGGSSLATQHTDILDQLSALRAGDTVALSSMLRQYRNKIAALEDLAEEAASNNQRLGGGSAAGIDVAGSLSPYSVVDSLREEDDLAWTTIKEGRAKVTVLRSALRHADAERVQWKTLCEEYQSAEGDVQRRIASLEDTNRAAATRLDAVQSLLQAREKDVARLKDQLHNAEEEVRSSDARHLEQRRATDASYRSEIDTLQTALSEASTSHARDVQQLQEQLEHERHAVAALREALEEMGVEMVMDS